MNKLIASFAAVLLLCAAGAAPAAAEQSPFTFPLHVNGRHICDYRADVVFYRNGVQHVVDVKSPPTRIGGSSTPTPLR